ERKRTLELGRVALEGFELLALASKRVGEVLVGDLEGEGDTSQLLDVLLALEIHALLRSHSRRRNKGFGDDLRRRQLSSPHDRTALDEARQHARGEPHRRAVVAPQLGEPSALEPLLENAQPGPIPDEHLAGVAASVDEQEQLAIYHLALEAGLHEPVEPVVALPQIDGRREREHPHRTTRAKNHRSIRSSVAASSTVRPSTR